MIVAICDDDKSFLEYLSAQLQKYSFVKKVLPFSDYDILHAEITDHFSPDLMIMDIDWGSVLPGGTRRSRSVGEEPPNGFTLAEELYRNSPRTKVLYITAHTDYYAPRMFLHQANICGFLNKPLDQKLLDQYIKRIQLKLEEELGETLTIQKRNRSFTIRARDILYLEINDHYLSLFMENREIEIYQSLKEIEKQLPVHFVRIHRSYIVNLDYVEQLTRSGVQIHKNGRNMLELPVGRVFYDDAKQKYMNWLADSI